MPHDGIAAGHERLGQPAPNKPGRAGDEDFHADDSRTRGSVAQSIARKGEGYSDVGRRSKAPDRLGSAVARRAHAARNSRDRKSAVGEDYFGRMRSASAGARGMVRGERDW